MEQHQEASGASLAYPVGGSRRFSSASRTDPDQRLDQGPGADAGADGTDGLPEEEASAVISARRSAITMISAAAMVTAAIIATVMAASTAGSADPPLDPAVATAIATTGDELELVTFERNELLGVDAVERALAAAQVAATSVADLQNDYRFLTPRIAKEGLAGNDRAAIIAGNLRGHLTAGQMPALADPWYLLASDAQAPTGIGLPATFASGFSWRPTGVYRMDEAGLVPVIWLATGTDGQLLAWASGRYDPVRSAFGQMTLGYTQAGQQASLAAHVGGQR